MAKRIAGTRKTKQSGNGENGGIVSLTKELFQAAITLRGSVWASRTASSHDLARNGARPAQRSRTKHCQLGSDGRLSCRRGTVGPPVLVLGTGQGDTANVISPRLEISLLRCLALRRPGQ